MILGLILSNAVLFRLLCWPSPQKWDGHQKWSIFFFKSAFFVSIIRFDIYGSYAYGQARAMADFYSVPLCIHKGKGEKATR